MSAEKLGEIDERILRDAVAATWKILTEPDYEEADTDKILNFFLHAMGGSRSVKELFFNEPRKKELIQALKSPEASPLIIYWRPKLSQPESIEVVQYARFMRQVTDLISRSHESLLADHNIAATTIAQADYPIRPAVSRRAGTHTGWSLHLTVSGSGEYDCIRQKFIARRGDLVLLGPDALYKYTAHESSQEWAYHWIYFQPNVTLVEWINWPELGPNIFHASVTGEAFDIFENLFLEAQRLNSTGDEIEKALFANLTEQILIRARKLVTREHLAFRDNRISEVKSHLSAHIKEQVSIADLAQHAGLSRSQLSALFKRATGQTILAWVNERRMALAAQLLLQTDHTVAAIADEIGISDALYFSRKFKSSTGLSPRDYRKNVAKMSDARSN